jgi:capsular exopolysaccharide synthesis family protein
MRRDLAPYHPPSNSALAEDFGFHAAPAEIDVVVGTGARYWLLAWRHKFLIILTTALCGLAAFGISQRLKPAFEATARVEVLNKRDGGLLPRLDANGTQAQSPDESYIQTQVELLRSKALFGRILAKENPERKISPAELTAEWRRLNVKANKLSRIIEVTYESSDPIVAAARANRVATEFIDHSREERWASATKTADWLKEKLGNLRADLTRAQDEMRRYASTTNLIYTGEKTSITTERLRNLQTELSAAEGDMIAKGAKFEIAAVATPDEIPEVLDDAALRDHQTKLTELRRQEAELGSLLTPEHYKVAQIKAQITQLESLYQKQRSHILGRLKLDYQAAQRKAQLLSDAFAAQAKTIHGEELSGIRYEQLRRDAEANRQLYDSLLHKIGEASLASVIQPNDIRLVDPAEQPFTPTRPRRLLITLGGAMGGLLLGFALAVALDSRDRSIKAPGEGADYLRIPEIASIPMIDHDPVCRKDRKVSLILRRAQSLDFRRDGALSTLIKWHSNPSFFAESFRGAALSLLFAGSRGRPPQVIVVSSALPQEGKSVFSVNVAISFARLGRSTLLIDGDTRRPKLHHLFGLAGQPGLLDLLSRSGDIDSIPGDLGHATAVPNLTVIGNDGSESWAPDALASERMASLLERCRREFDTIIVDSPPVLLIPDARALGRIGDGVVLVVRARQTSRDAAQRAVDRFVQDGTPILGTVLNSWSLKSSDLTSYYDYGRQS